MPPVIKQAKEKADDVASAEDVLAVARAEAEEIKAKAQEEADALIKQAKEKADDVASAEDDDSEVLTYRVVNCGVSYCLPGKPNSRRFARKGELIDLDAGEAKRLRKLEGVVGEDEPDPTPADAPREHAKEQESKQEHAAKVLAAKAAESQ